MAHGQLALTCIVVGLVLGPSAAMSENPETLAERSQSRARAVLTRAVDAFGGPASLNGIAAVRLTLEGDIWPRLQMPTVSPPFTPGMQQETLLLDLKNNRLRLDQSTSGAGFEGKTTTILQPDNSAVYDHRARTVTPVPEAQATQQQFVQYQRRLPHLLLRQALARETSLRYLGEDEFDGRKHEVITFVMPDTQQVALYVDQTSHLVSKYELVITDAIAGEDVSEIVFGDYTKVGNIPVPRRWKWFQVGERMAEFKLGVELNPAVTDASFVVAARDYAAAPPAPNNFDANVEKLADGVYVVHNIAGPNQNTLVVEFKDHIFAVEAPGNSAGSDAVIARIKEIIPNKPVQYVAATHHHGDHIGGLRSYIAEGAKVVTVRSNQGLIEAIAAAPQIDRLSASPRAPQFEFVEKRRRVFSDSTQTLELINIGPHPHAWDMLIAYLPKHRIVFQGDMYFAANNDAPAGPPQASTLAFAKRLQEAKLDVERIASVHGRTATLAEFTRDLQPSLL